ncbi:MAG TPA: type II toxin-antitoxin system PemK/MazF family toxin [Pseudonocardiaceae bacterium]|jgi:mRNA interferase MazF|nr:type II toxin-antitoxin system PemK/MazF family toxin [Pseudonocardiaceae bacterium]
MTLTTTIEPWQVWLAEFGTPAGSEPGGTRPAVVVGSEDHCRFPIEMALVVPLTARDRGLPHHIPISSTESGLSRPSWARTEDIRAISTRRFTRPTPLGRLSDQEVEQVRKWIHRMLA